MVSHAQPVRVIYAKLTSTGAYDVVAKTANVPLDRARALAEKLLPGNPPIGADVGEAIAHLRPPEGGHIVLRFARYDWADSDRGDVFITDILWLSDEDFSRARANAFALVPRTDGVFAELTELPPIAIADGSVTADLQRIAALRDVGGEAKTVIASAAAVDSALLVHGGNRAAAMELFTLLLPPRMREALTFQTQAFRVPGVLPRLTLVDRAYANLRDAPWKMLPNVDIDVPLELAGRLVALADDAELLALTHELYDESYDDVADLRPGIVRLTRLASIAHALQRRDTAEVLRQLEQAEPRVRAAALRRLRTVADAGAMRRAFVQLLQDGNDGGAHAIALLRELDQGAIDVETTFALIAALPASASDDVRAELATRAAFHGDLPHLISLLSTDPRTIAGRLPLDDTRIPDDVRRLLTAVREATSIRADLDAAARLLTEAQSVLRTLPAASSAALHRICRESVQDALERTAASTSAVAGMRRLQDAAAAYATSSAGTAPLPALLAPNELASHPTGDDVIRVTDDYPAAARAVLGGALLTRAWDAHARGDAQECRTAAAHASVLLSRTGAAGRELARQILAEHNVPDHELAAMPGADALLPILGGSAPQAAHTRRIVAALSSLAAANENGLPDLAAAVYGARANRVRIVPATDMWERVIAALGDVARAQSARADAAAVEITVELLSIITDPRHVSALEDVLLGDGMVVRLHRLDRSVAQCRAAEDEDRYEQYARAVESAAVPFDPDARERLRDALGTRGLKRRLLRAVSSVVERDAS